MAKNKSKYTTGVFITIVLLQIANCIQAQGLEKILIERYHESGTVNQTDSVLPKGYVTYRIYADLADGYNLQTIFGYPNHELIIETTTSFYNHPLGSGTADNINDNLLSNPGLAFDSWITLGAATKRHYGIPLDNDCDGSIINEYGFSVSDGLTPKLAPSFIKYDLNLAVFEENNGSQLTIKNGLLGVLGGVMGTTEKNKVLLAQITTDGEISFELNLQIGSENCGEFKRYVAQNPKNEEIQFEGLTYNR